MQLKQVDAGIFFDSAEGNDQNASHFYNDLEMYTNNASTPFPTSYMLSWYGGKDGANIAQKSNQWRGQNESRWQNAEYDAAFETARLLRPIPKWRRRRSLQLNDLVISTTS